MGNRITRLGKGLSIVCKPDGSAEILRHGATVFDLDQKQMERLRRALAASGVPGEGTANAAQAI